MDEALRRLEQLQGQEARRRRQSAAGQRAFGREVLHARHDGHHPQPRPERSSRSKGLAKRSNNPRFAYDSYRRLIQMFGSVVLDIPKHAFEEVFDGKKKQRKAKLDTDLDAKALQEVIAEYKKVVKKHTKRDFPQDPHRPAGHGARRRVPLLAERSRQALSPHQQHRRHARHRGQRAGDGLRQPGRDQRHRRGLYPQSRPPARRSSTASS